MDNMCIQVKSSDAAAALLTLSADKVIHQILILKLQEAINCHTEISSSQPEN
jgi:hypothetical protein